MSRPFRALLLAAGLGTRLRPLTLHTPKCPVSIGGEPLLGRWLRQLEAAAARLSSSIPITWLRALMTFLEGWSPDGMQVHSVHEPELLGTAGTLLANQDFFEDQQAF